MGTRQQRATACRTGDIPIPPARVPVADPTERMGSSTTAPEVVFIRHKSYAQPVNLPTEREDRRLIWLG